MNRSKELITNTAMIALSRISTQFISFLLLPLYTSLLSPSQYGIVDIVSTYVQILIPIFFLQIDQSGFRYLIEAGDDAWARTRIITNVIGVIVAQIVIMLVSFAIVMLYVEIDYCVYLLATVIVTAFSTTMLQVTRGLKQSRLYASGSFLTGALSIVLNVLLITVLNMGTEGILLSNICANLACILYLAARLKIHNYIRLELLDKKLIKKLLKYSLPLVPNAIFLWIINASDRTIVLAFLGTSQNGILSIAHKFPSVLIIIYNTFHVAWTESAIRYLKSMDGIRFFESIFRNAFRVFSSICLVIIAVMPFVFPLLINENYHVAYWQTPIFMLASLFSIIAGLYSVIYLCYEDTKNIAKTTVISAVIHIVIAIALINSIGLYAVSISSVIAYAFVAFYRHFDSKRFIKPTSPTGDFVVSILVYVFVIICYYIQSVYLQLIALIVALIYSIIMNRMTIKRGVIWLRHRLG